MPSPFRADQLSPQMRARYGMDTRSRAPLVISLLTAAILGFVGWLTIADRGDRVDATLLSWDAKSDHVTAVFEVRRADGQEARCVLRAQDRSRIDVGYAFIDVPAGADAVEVTYELATLMPAFIVELLGCSVDGDPRVNPPQFPPAVVPPSQPWVG